MNIIKTAVALAFVVVLAACGDLEEADAGSDGGPQTNSGNSDNPPPDDVEVTECAAEPDLGWVVARGNIVNHSSEPSTYFIEVEFVDAAGTRFDESIASSSTVAPDQQVEWEAPGTENARDGFQCNVTSVERYAA